MITILVSWLIMPVATAAGLHLAARTWPSYLLMVFTAATLAVVYGGLGLTILAVGALVFMSGMMFFIPNGVGWRRH